MNAPLLPALRAEGAADAPAVEALDDRAFGPGRFTKVSERVREFAQFRRDLSFCAWRGEELVGTVRQWLVQVGGQEVVFLGPLAVDEDERKHGLGARLVERACQAAAEAGYSAVLLVGDAPYFQRLGFVQAPDVVMPGPVDQRRVLVRALTGREPGLAGSVRAV